MSENQKWTADQMPDQRGKTVIITGANSGIGYEAALALAGREAEVIMACRSIDKGQTAVDQIRTAYPQAKLILKPLDLADLASVKSFAAEYRREFNKLDILVNNAGVMATPYRQTADGFELQFGTNHLGHFALTALLFDILQGTPHARVVTVSSYAHLLGRINFADLNSEKRYQRWLAYGQSKLANLLFAYELQRRANKTGGNPISIAVHPGYAATNLQHTSTFFSFANSFMAQGQDMGALPTLYAAASPDIRGGEYIGPDGFLAQRGYPHLAKSSKASHNLETAKKLWDVSEELTGVKFEI